MAAPARTLPSYQAPTAEDLLEELAHRSRSLADRVESISRRRDVLAFRVRLVLLLLELSCPLTGAPRKRWYVPGACARLGPAGLRRAWYARFGEEPRSLRTFRAHLGELERGCLITRSPGDWVPVRLDPRHPERRPRYAETIHVLEDEQVATWWATAGAALQKEHPRTRCSPDRWDTIFDGWRRRARRDLEGLLPFPGLGDPQHDITRASPASSTPAAATAEDLPEGLRRARAIVRAIRDPKVGPVETALQLAAAGIRLRGRKSFQVPSNLERMRGAAAMLAAAYARGDRIRNPEGWLVRAWQYARLQEMRAACRAFRIVPHD